MFLSSLILSTITGILGAYAGSGFHSSSSGSIDFTFFSFIGLGAAMGFLGSGIGLIMASSENKASGPIIAAAFSFVSCLLLQIVL